MPRLPRSRWPLGRGTLESTARVRALRRLGLAQDTHPMTPLICLSCWRHARQAGARATLALHWAATCPAHQLGYDPHPKRKATP